ncbi:MAG TPA: hypothetical protein VFJ93_07770 [Gaiellaceae bacterium]|nr:hypothetical protein [Gaiellaceae bacterium]
MLEAIPGFNDDLRQAEADLEAGRGIEFEQQLDDDAARDVLGTIDRQERQIADLREALEPFIDDEPCRFDHHGGCQTHGFLNIEPGDVCGMVFARRVLAERPQPSDPSDEAPSSNGDQRPAGSDSARSVAALSVELALALDGLIAPIKWLADNHADVLAEIPSDLLPPFQRAADVHAKVRRALTEDDVPESEGPSR